MRIAIIPAFVLLVGCASEPFYNPNNAVPRAQDELGPHLKCPVGSAVFCDREGGARIRGRLVNCRCQK